MNHIVRGRKRVLGIALALVVLLALLLAACGGDDDGNGDGNGDNGGEPAGSTTQPADNPDAADTGTTPEIGPPLTPVATEPPPPPNTPVGPPDQESFQNAADWASADLASRLDVSITLVTVLEPETPFLMDTPPVCPEVDEEIIDLQYVYVQHERLIYPYQYYVLAEPDPDTGEALVVQACDDVLVDEDVLYVPTPDARAAILTQVEADLLARNVDPTRGQFRTVRKMTWFDTKLGCPLKAYEGEEATPAAIDGYLVIYELDGVEYEYHTDLTGEWIQFCEPPTGYASIEAFAFTLANKGDYDFVR
ncbi:MAG: hypothetical protein JXQ72_00685, partial [Anaerolineae bacterium]|nr:hypothetical protein [Anaerolineae bacterium]